ncbi:lysine-2,3-aminomutase-like protein [Plastorhodobacter daqingensis]|uniref:Lysine-2,3-aminomutase-like protein n=1 Tax=Plastorhodobacter daqingensis TaxID=1387281 RepID=A0ABW2ULF5_9RHOB
MPPRALTTVRDLIEAGLAPAADEATLDAVAEAFRIRITPAMQSAIGADPAADPVAQQFLPRPDELAIKDGELDDPIGDSVHSPTRGLTHRYPDRVILAATHTCEVYCRFCFRREKVGEEGALPEADLSAALDYIAATPAIHEVILTGGDPMVLSPRRIAALLDRLAAIPHVDVVRFHTRIPVVAPERVTADLVAALGRHPAVYVVIHTNHAQELTPEACAALARLAGAGVPLLSQTVLLRGINDEVAALAALFRTLVRNRVKPYYLHHCDLARGTSHFRTTIARGQALMAALRGQISGLCLPTYVLDIPGGFGKVPIGPGHLEPVADGSWRVTDPSGRVHGYADPPGLP